MDPQSLVIGEKYRHYKGNIYRLIAIAQHSETHEPLVVYQSVIDSSEYWARPLEMFCEELEVDGKNISRFTHV